MKTSKYSFRLRTPHFVIAIAAFSLCLVLLSNSWTNSIPESKDYGRFETFDETFAEEGYDFVFFYSESCALCNKMRYNLEQCALEENRSIRYREVNIDEQPAYYHNYNVSGVPNIIVFKGDKEIKRIMGIVPPSNLKKIQNKILQG